MPFRKKTAYLLSQYPAVSHTFFFNEIAAMRQRGFAIETASINAVAPPADGFSEQETAECRQTYYVKSGSKVSMLLRVLGICAKQPGVLFRGLGEAFRLTPWDGYGTLYALFYLAEALLVGRWMREKECDHLHVHFSGPVATVALLTSVAWEIPFSLSVHGPDEFFNIDKFFLKKKIERATFVTCISNFCRSQLIRIVSPQIWDKFHVCRLGVSDKVFFPEQREPSAVLQLVSVGRLHPSKGQSILIQSVRELLDLGLPVHLNLIGGGVNRAALEAQVAALGLGEAVTFYGATSHSRTRSILRTADIFVLSSFAEGVPVALMEAMGMEIACVSTFVAGIPELIRSGETGLLVAPGSTDELTAALASLVRDPALRSRLAAGGGAKVLADYNLDKNAERLAEVFHRYGR